MVLENPKYFRHRPYRIVNSDANIELIIAKVLAGKTIGGQELGVTISDTPVSSHGIEFVDLNFSNPVGQEVFDRIERSPQISEIFYLDQFDRLKENPGSESLMGLVQKAFTDLFD